MPSFSITELKARKNEDVRVSKRVLKTNLTTNKVKHAEYTTDLIDAYNNIISYFSPVFERAHSELKEHIRNR